MKTHTFTFGSDTARRLFALGVALMPFGFLTWVEAVAGWVLPFPLGLIVDAGIFLVSLAAFYAVYEEVLDLLAGEVRTN